MVGKRHGAGEAKRRLSQAERWAPAAGMEKKGIVELLEGKELVRTRKEGRR